MLSDPQVAEPTPWQVEHLEAILESYRRLLGRPLVEFEPTLTAEQRYRRVFCAPWVLVSHGVQEDPIFNYGNATALSLWEMSWAEFTSLPSRYSAEEQERSERARLLHDVAERGFSDAYSGIRASKRGRRFMIRNATVFNVHSENGEPLGQAATFSSWLYLDS